MHVTFQDNTPLHIAASKGFEECVGCLVRVADANKKDFNVRVLLAHVLCMSLSQRKGADELGRAAQLMQS